MAATNGDSVNLVDTALGAIWNGGDSRVEVHSVDVSTGSGGSGSAAVNYNEAFEDSVVFAFVTGQADGRWYASAAGSSQATVNVDGGAANSTLTANLLVIGKDPSA